MQKPDLGTLPSPRKRATRGGPELSEFQVSLEVTTPILGGGYKTREIDNDDVIRGPSIRGQLRFWWRALYGSAWATPEELYERESKIWGKAASDNDKTGGRSKVELRVVLERKGKTDATPINLDKTPGAYALWPARENKKAKVGPAPRRQPGTQFRLLVRVPHDIESQVRNSIRAWILFGGYGSRTRRGLGSLTVRANPQDWLPEEPTRDSIEKLFGVDIFETPDSTPGDVPWLGGSSLRVGGPTDNPTNAEKAWTIALGWLKEFRQGVHGAEGNRAREPGDGKPLPNRPSISNWPEPDKIRHLTKKIRSHTPKHNERPVWPRASFGLPINGRFQTQDRHGNRNGYDEPKRFEIRWRRGNDEFDRLASPLILKPLPLANGTFVPCALWLNRAYPKDGEVHVKGLRNSGAPFDRLVAEGDTPRFAALDNQRGLRVAFLKWLHERERTIVVTE